MLWFSPCAAIDPGAITAPASGAVAPHAMNPPSPPPATTSARIEGPHNDVRTRFDHGTRAVPGAAEGDAARVMPAPPAVPRLFVSTVRPVAVARAAAATGPHRCSATRRSAHRGTRAHDRPPSGR